MRQGGICARDLPDGRHGAWKECSRTQGAMMAEGKREQGTGVKEEKGGFYKWLML